MNINELIMNQIVPQIKQPIWDSWYIKEKIGAGGFSVVYRVEAQRISMVDEAALKISAIVSDRSFSSEEKKKSFLEKQKVNAENETIILKKLRDCPYIVRYEDEKTEPFYVDGAFEGYYSLIRMELLDPLDKLLYKHEFDYSQANVERLAREIGQALQFAHRNGVIHRDLKPENIFVSKSGTYKLGDFNISKKAVSTHSFAGSNYYMAPEIMRVMSDADESYTNQADIYSFGIVLYQLMNDDMFPFESDDVSATEAADRRMKGEPLPAPKNASDKFARIILKACAYDTKDRYASMDELLSDLNSSEPIPTPAVSRPEPAEDPNKTVYVASEPKPEPKADANATVYIGSNETDTDKSSAFYTAAPKLKPAKKTAIIAGVAAVAVIAGIVIFPKLSKGDDGIASEETTSDTAVAAINENAGTAAPESANEEGITLPSIIISFDTSTALETEAVTETTSVAETTTTTVPGTEETEKTTTTPKETTAATTTTLKITTAATTAATTAQSTVKYGFDSEYVFATGDLHVKKANGNNYFTVETGYLSDYKNIYLEISTIDTDGTLVSLGQINDAFSQSELKHRLKTTDSKKEIIMDLDTKWLHLDGMLVPAYDMGSYDGWEKGWLGVPCYSPSEQEKCWLNYQIDSSGKMIDQYIWDSTNECIIETPLYDIKLDYDCYYADGTYDGTYYFDTGWEYSPNAKVTVKPIHGEIVYRYVFETQRETFKTTDWIYRNVE